VERFAPFAAYRPTSKKTRDVEAGPHLAFLRLKKDLLGNRRRYRENLERFVNDYGLLGLFSSGIRPRSCQRKDFRAS
jgi:hypothetical protein